MSVPAWQLARSSDPDTSHAAAHAVHTEAMTAAVLAVVERRGPSTVDEVATELGIDRERLSKRMSDLKNLGQVVDTGSRRVGRAGRWQIVWRAVDGFDDPPDTTDERA